MEAETGIDGKILLKYLNVFSKENLPSNDVEYKQKDVHIEEMGYLVNNLDIFIRTASNTFSRGQVICKLTEMIVSFGLVPKCDTDDQDFGPENFPHVAEYAEKCFKYLKMLLQQIENLDHSHRRQFLINVILLCATHNTTNAWTSDASIQISKEFSKDLFNCTQHQDFSSLLTDDKFHPTIFKGTLKKMRPSLLKDTWMLHPSSAHVFCWLLNNVKHPYLVDYLSDVLPPAFMFSSYHKPDEKRMGIQCFFHILDNVPQSLIKLDGTEDAIYHTLSPYIYSKEPKVVSVLFPCLLKLPMMKPQKTEAIFWKEFDTVFNHLLFAVKMESSVELKRLFLTQIFVYSEHTPPFKHLKCIIEIVEDTISETVSLDATCKIKALQILKSVIKFCWPRMPRYCLKIIILLLELNENKENLTNSDETSKIVIPQLCEECIILLKHACGETFESLTANFLEDCGDMPEAIYLKSVLAQKS